MQKYGGIIGVASVNVIEGVLINGKVTLQGSARPEAGRVVSITLRLFNTGAANADLRSGTGALLTLDANTVDTGNDNVAFQVMEVVPGTYDITVVSAHTLINVKRNVAVSAGGNTVDFGTLLEGNCNNDRQVTIVDFTILVASYGKSSTMPGFDARADFDRNNRVDIIDFTMLASNYQKSSPQEVASP